MKQINALVTFATLFNERIIKLNLYLYMCNMITFKFEYSYHVYLSDDLEINRKSKDPS